MDANERAAAATASAAAVGEINSTVERMSRVIRRRVRGGLSVLGPAGTAPMAAVDAVHAVVHTSIGAATKVGGAAVGEALRVSTPTDAESLVADPRHAASVSALGAAFGDRLPVALAPHMRVTVADDEQVTPSLAVLLHGLGGHEWQWSPDYAAALRAAGVAPVFVRYTSGRPIEESGAEFAALVDGLVAQWPVPIERIILVGHSMGGLLIASAFAQAAPQSTWPGLTTDVVTLGTPHHGAPLERVSDRLLRLAARWPTVEPLADLGQRRSQGIKDLAVGVPHPLPDSVHHHAVVAHMGDRRMSLTALLLGDGMVPPASAAGHAPHSDSVTVVELERTGHMRLLDHPDVTSLLARVAAAGSGDSEADPSERT